MKSTEIREKFLKYFEERGHKIVPSSSLIPEDDPTLLFANAGMNQFKKLILGLEKKDYNKAASSQKCIRVSGKHNDLEEVGKDTFHHTFFEMLGNWSFGDYFKKEAISYAWELLTEVYKLQKDRLWVTVFRDDDEAERLWYENTDIKKGRVLKFYEKENFWEMAEVGPCGPCSEIHYDRGKEYSCSKPNCGVNCGCGRVIEVWNLVFMQYFRDENGKLTDLPSKNVDTGMGFERLTAILQNVDSNYDTDLFLPIIKKTEEISGEKYKDALHSESFRVIADHIRALSFAIADGTIPSNEGRGYVIRRILRRASRHGRLLDLHKPFLFKLSSIVVDLMGKVYPELKAKKEHISLVIKSEEERFGETLDSGIELFEEVAGKVIKKGEKVIPGEEAFKLYDTFGFPIDLTQVMAREKGLQVDLNGFNNKMTEQQERSRGTVPQYLTPMFDKAKLLNRKTESVCYDCYETEAQILSESHDMLGVPYDAIILDRTPFYAESGGQIGDTGIIFADDFEFKVSDTRKEGEVILHIGKISKGKIEDVLNKKVIARVDVEKRKSIMRNHTATHLLHKVLRETLGEHVHQAGSLVEPERFRFDFTHFKDLTEEEIEKIEYKVNQKIWENLEVKTFNASLNEAKKLGAMALFGEKYEDTVRVVQIDDYSRELCGGTHVKATGEIGLFRIISESSIAAGMRRIEAVTGKGAYGLIKKEEKTLEELSAILKVNKEDLGTKVTKLLESSKEMEKKVKVAEAGSAKEKIKELYQNAFDLEGIKIISYKDEKGNREYLLSLADALRENLKSSVGIFATVLEDKISFVVAVTDDLVKKGIKAGEIVKQVATSTGGTGGGKPHLAQGGGKDRTKLDFALSQVPEIIKNMLK
ncbi:MAG: alanine--tRNA ligase [candidate division Zixibacteria bacterium]|nr:alanine--tRNA ligase [candidate division Zixibacteria bacterium]